MKIHIGGQYGELTVLGRERGQYRCQCSCGAIVLRCSSSLRREGARCKACRKERQPEYVRNWRIKPNSL